MWYQKWGLEEPKKAQRECEPQQPTEALLREEKMEQRAAQKTGPEGEAPVSGSPWCEWCGNPVHRWRECPDVPPDWCGLCEGFGHEWQECPNRDPKTGRYQPKKREDKRYRLTREAALKFSWCQEDGHEEARRELLLQEPEVFWGEVQTVRDCQPPQETLLRKRQCDLQLHIQTQDDGKKRLQAQREEQQKLKSQLQELKKNMGILKQEKTAALDEAGQWKNKLSEWKKKAETKFLQNHSAVMSLQGKLKELEKQVHGKDEQLSKLTRNVAKQHRSKSERDQVLDNKEKKIGELTAELQNCVFKIKELENQLEKSEEHERIIVELQKKNKVKEAENKELFLKLQQAQVQSSEMGNRVKETEDQLYTLKRETERLKQELEHKEEGFEKLKIEALKSKEEMHRAAEKCNADVQQILKGKNSEIQEVQNFHRIKQKEMEETVSELEREVQSLVRELQVVQESKGNEIAELKKSADYLKAEWEEKLQCVVSKMKREKFELQKKYKESSEDANSHLSQLETRVQQLTVEVEDSTLQCQKLTQEKVVLEQHQVNSITELYEVNLKYNAMWEEKEVLGKKLVEANKEVEKHSTRVKQLTQEKERLQKLYKMKESEAAGGSRESDTLKKEVHYYAKTKKRLEDTASKLTLVRGKAEQEKLMIHQAESKELDTQKRAFKERLCALKSHVKYLEAEKLSTEFEFADYRKVVLRQKVELQNLREQVKGVQKLEGQVKQHESILQEVQMNRGKFQQDLQKWMKQSSEMESQVKELCKLFDARKGVGTVVREALRKICTALKEAKQQRAKQEEGKVNLKPDLRKLNWEARMHQEELRNRAQALMGNLQKTHQENKFMLKDIEAMEENRSNVSQCLKELQTQLEKQKQSGKEALVQKERINQKGDQEHQKKTELAFKDVNGVKCLLQTKAEEAPKPSSQENRKRKRKNNTCTVSLKNRKNGKLERLLQRNRRHKVKLELASPPATEGEEAPQSFQKVVSEKGHLQSLQQPLEGSLSKIEPEQTELVQLEPTQGYPQQSPEMLRRKIEYTMLEYLLLLPALPTVNRELRLLLNPQEWTKGTLGLVGRPEVRSATPYRSMELMRGSAHIRGLVFDRGRLSRNSPCHQSGMSTSGLRKGVG